MDTLPDRSVTHVCKPNCHLCQEVQQLVGLDGLELDFHVGK